MSVFHNYERIKQLHTNPLSPCSVQLIKKNEEFFALKKIKKNYINSETLKIQALQEIECCNNLKHQNLIKIYVTKETQDYYLILMEYIRHANYFYEKIDEVKNLIKNLQNLKNEHQIKIYVKDILNGLQYIHQQGYVHCDIKLENLFCIKGNKKLVKIGDFGLMQKKNTNTNTIILKEPIGTSLYMAPELKKQYFSKFLEVTDKIDIYSMGIVIYKMFTAYHPFKSSNNLAFLTEDWKMYSIESQNFIKNCLEQNPQQRMSAQEALQHQWLQN